MYSNQFSTADRKTAVSALMMAVDMKYVHINLIQNKYGNFSVCSNETVTATATAHPFIQSKV